MFRHQLPTYSHLNFGALASGALAAFGSGAGEHILGRIRERWQSRHVLLTDSGTSALRLSIATVVRNTERPVALPAYSCYDLVTAAVGANARIVFYDVDATTLAPDRDSLQRALAFNPAALVVVHHYGIPVPLNEIKQLAAKSDCVVIEDAAQAVGAELDGRPVGSFGSFGILSFGRGKGLTGGGGGALLCNDERAELLVRAPGIVRQLNVGAKGIGELIRATAQWMLARPSIYAVPQALPFLALGETVYHEPSEPRRMSTIATAVLNEVWERSHAAVDVRRRNATRLLSTVKASKAFVAVNVSSHADPGYLRLPVLAASREIAHDSQRQARIGVIRGYPMPLPQLHAAHTCCVNCNEKFPGAALLAEQLITLPTHGLLNENDLRALERWLATFGTATRILDAPAKSPSY